MTLAVFTTAQIVAQLDSHNHWAGSTITYSTSSTPNLIGHASSGRDLTLETTTFTTLNDTQSNAATLAMTLWGDLIAPSLAAVNEAAGTNANIDFAAFKDSPSNGNYAYTLSSASVNPDGVTGTLTKASVWVNDSFNAANGYVSGDLSNPVVGKYAFQSYIHESGHALGLEHMGNYNGNTGSGPSSYQDSLVYSVMSYYGPNSALGGQALGVAWADWGTYMPQTPMLDDVLAIQSIYGVSTATRTGNTTYGFHSTLAGVDGGIYDFNQNAHPIMCIVDSSGNDTLDLSGDTHNDVIDLHAGAFSSVMGLTNNISIAYSTTIENAVGGSGNDTIIGNDVANILYGGAGDDTLLSGHAITLNAAEASVYRLYQATLDREPELAGLKGWEKALNGGQSLEQVTSGFVNSAEFQNTYGTLNNTQFVTLLYNNVLHRAPDAGGIANWVNMLNTGSSHSAVVDGFSESAEFQNNTAFDTRAYATTTIDDSYLGQVYRLYQATLNRAPDAGGLQSWMVASQAGQSLVNITSGFVNSAEFQNTYGELNNTQFVTLLYNNVLHRTPDAGGLAGWVNHLNTDFSRSDVVNGFSESVELINSSKAAMATFVQSTMAPVWSDTLNGGMGNDTLVGGVGADTFHFQVNGGVDQVYGLEAWDHVQMAGFNYANPAATLTHMTQVGQDEVFVDQGETIIFHHTQLATLDTAGIFILA